ncbi:MAG: cytochrome c biogenesis heme-transporting ATPase CcmA [Pseudomonadales bacterium]|nr:cytochrome c biogenesis heme-transporting ATPase CcmA [Pseudomonadales bacterium]
MTTSSKALLTIQNLSCERGFRQLFQQLNFELFAGEVIRIAGPNGAGKSTLLNVLAGISSDFDGDILYQNQPIKDVSYEYRENLCYLGHAKAVKTPLTPRENLQWFCSMYPTRSDTSIDAVLEQVGLMYFKDQICAQLSAGQKQRVALARLIISAAKIWILDEPFTAIDQSGVQQFETLIAEFAQDGGAVLVTTHHALNITGNYRCLDLGDYL